jgi:hypothetical protein
MADAEEIKRTKIRKLIDEVHAQKIAVDEKRSQTLVVEADINRFSSGYSAYVVELDNQQKSLESQIYRVRRRIMELQEPDQNVEPGETKPKFAEPLKDDNLSGQGGLGDQLQKPVDHSLEKKKLIRKHFAWRWHPDKKTDHPSGQMTELNVVFERSQDAADMLAAIPWDVAWTEAGRDETPGAQWERLTEWLADLDTALQRMDDLLIQLQRHRFYPHLAEWRTHENKADYFATLSESRRKQIRELERTLAILREELSNWERDHTTQ